MKKLKPLYVITSLFIAGLIGCAEQKSSMGQLSPVSNDNIVGGKNAKYTESTASSVVFISTENAQGHNQICTGFSKTLILTAAHCIARHKDGMSVSFRKKTFLNDQDLTDVPIAEAYQLDFTDLHKTQNLNGDQIFRNEDGQFRDDLGIIEYQGGLPEGATIASLPASDLTAKSSEINFTAIGYGKNTGINTDDPLAITGEGILRYKNLTVNKSLLKSNSNTFIVDQFKNKGGVCSGDSGGPALVVDSLNKKNMVIGVASAVMTLRTNVQGLNSDDDCQNESLYLNMYYYTKYLDQYLKIARAKKAAQQSAQPATQL